MNNDKLKTFLPVIIFVAAAFVLAYQFVDPAPPNTLTLSAGSKGGAYYTYAEQYRDYLKQRGITVHILESAGSQENVERLTAGKADVAFVQGGIASPEDTPLMSLGSLYYEPLWVFVRADADIKSLLELKGKSIAIGSKGSGTRILSLQILNENDVDEGNSNLLAISGSVAAKELLNGSVEAVFLVAGASASTVQQLNQNIKVKLLSFTRAEAYTRRIATLSSLKLPEGVLHLANNIPAQDITLLAPTATLLVNANTHPALQDLLMQTAAYVHGGRSLFSSAGEFPTARYTALTLSKQAQHFYKSGPPFLQRYLPFWAATMVDRLKVMLLPFIALLIPLFKLMPPLYRWRVRSRIYRWYDELSRIDLALAEELDQTLFAELDRIENEIRKVQVPLSYADELYSLRMHLALIRDSAIRKG
ncbi:MAG: C4-dicarboxylate ABC transporter substrate-binding protein [Proteobacteria bacterium]|nr:MAG: C4-dicarboxylate ABC transporter substrate-binding protein [Pseudomonadota bacterium]